MFKMNMKNNLDERQELALLKIESKGCWLAFWGLLIVMAVEMIFFNQDPKTMAGEWIVFMILAFYLLCECQKAGIYDRHLKPTLKTCFWSSLAAGCGMGLVMFLMVWHNYPDKPEGSIAAGVFMGAFTFVLTFITLGLTTKSFVKKQAKLEMEAEEEDDMTM